MTNLMTEWRNRHYSRSWDVGRPPFEVLPFIYMQFIFNLKPYLSHHPNEFKQNKNPTPLFYFQTFSVFSSIGAFTLDTKC